MLTIRPFEPTDAEYKAIASVEKAVWPENPDTVADFRHRDDSRDLQYLYQRLVGVVDGEIVAFADYGDTPWTYEPGRYFLGIYVHPDREGRGIGSAMYNYIIDTLNRRQPRPQLLIAGTRENKPQAVRFLCKRGFQQVMRWIVLTLDVTAFDTTNFAGLQEQVQNHGIQIAPLSALQFTDPEWQRKTYELDWELTLDEPLPAPPTKLPFEQFVKRCFEGPSFMPEGWFIALDGKRYVGMSYLLKNAGVPEQLFAGFTGVVRGYRRRGIATVLKVCTIEHAQRVGAKSIRTGNEENNPMYQLNVKVGFQMVTASLAFEKRLGQASHVPPSR